MQFTTEHAIAVHVIKDWKLCEDSKKNVMCLLVNRGRSDFVQLRNIDVKHGVDVGKTILNLFLGFPNS